MSHSFRLNPLGLAVCGALAMLANTVQAQIFDANSPAVREAYVGAATQEKKDAALAGLEQLLPQPRKMPDGGSCIGGCGFFLRGPPDVPFVFGPLITSTIFASNDADLGTPGTAVTLDSTRLRSLASFTTPRDFLVTTNGGAIDTNGFNLTLSGNLTVNGMLRKEGFGTLLVTGNNLWNSRPHVASGVIEGNSNSLQTSMWLSDGTAVRFNQISDGTYSGVLDYINGLTGRADFEKSGTGRLTLTSAQNYRGYTTISAGTLALQGTGSLGPTSGLNINAGATFDIGAATGMLPSVGTLSGAGTLVLGSQQLSAGAVANSVFGGSINGSGGLTKDGSGTLTLTGVNTYTGATNINGGTLALVGAGRLNANTDLSFSSGILDISASPSNQTFGSVSGGGLILLGGNTLTVGRSNRDASFGGFISGSGGITKTGTGSWTLSGANTYTGFTTIEQGNLIAQTQSISDRVTNNAALTFTENKDLFNPFISAYSGSINGTGQLIKAGDGIIWLRGRNTYTGGTEVKEGALIGNTDSLQGNIVNNAALAFYQADNGTYTGYLSGSGTLLQYGPGTLTLTGNNTYTGGTAFSGTLHVDRDANLGASNGALVIAGGTLRIAVDMTSARNIALTPDGGTFDTNGNNLTLTGNVSGPGGLTKSGAGTLILAGTNTYKSATLVNAGRLEVNGSIISNVVVAAGAELGGTGLITNNFILNRGRLSRGSGIGDIRTQGTFSFEPGSVFSVKTNAAGNSDRLIVAALPFNPDPLASPAPSGKATLNGGSVEVLAENGNYRRETRYQIVAAERGVTGQFAGVTSNLAFLAPSLSYDPNNVYLTLKRNDLNYAAVAQNGNQINVAQSLTRMANGGTADAATVTTVLDGLSAQQARAAFDSIGGAGRTLMLQSMGVNQRAVNQTLVARIASSASTDTLAPAAGIAGRGVQLAYDESTRNDAAPAFAQLGLPAGTGYRAANNDARNGLWLRAYGGSGRLDGDANAPGAKYHYGGTLAGFDHHVSHDATLGVFVGYAQPRYNQDTATSSAKAKTWQVGAYGRMVSGAWHVDGVASYARNDTDTSRLVSVGGLSRTATGAFDGEAWSTHLETGYTLKAGSFDVQPLAALSWTRQHQDAYNETGAGALNLIVSDQSQTSLRSSVGVRTLRPFTSGGTQWAIETRAAWSHEFKTTRSVNARLAGDPAAGVFTVSGPNVPRDSAVLGVGIAAQASKNLRLYADMNTEFNGASRAYAVSAGLRYQW